MCMFLILSGKVEIMAKMDNGFEYAVDECTRGNIINSSTFLTEDVLKVSART